MSEKLWFGCPKCFLAFYSNSEYEKHYGSDHVGMKSKSADRIGSKG